MKKLILIGLLAMTSVVSADVTSDLLKLRALSLEAQNLQVRLNWTSDNWSRLAIITQERAVSVELVRIASKPEMVKSCPAVRPLVIKASKLVEQMYRLQLAITP